MQPCDWLVAENCPIIPTTPGIPLCYISSPSDNLSMRYLLSSFVNFVDGVTEKQEGRAVAGNYRVMLGTYTESFHLILGQRSD